MSNPLFHRGYFQGTVSLITGGANGIGRACAARFVRAGGKAVILDLPDTPGHQVAAELGPDCIFFPGDVKAHFRLVIFTFIPSDIFIFFVKCE